MDGSEPGETRFRVVDVGDREVREKHGLVVRTEQNSRKGPLLMALDGVGLHLESGGDGVVDVGLGEGVAGREEGVAGHWGEWRWLEEDAAWGIGAVTSLQQVSKS